LRRLHRHAAEVFFAFAIVGLVAVTAIATAINVIHKGWSGDAAAWAQAGGSIVAIAGAAWIARSEARHARYVRRLQSEEAAWNVRFVLAQAQFDTQIVAAELAKPEMRPTAEDLRRWRQLAANSSLALTTMLQRADYVHSAIVLVTCNAKVLMDELARDIDRLGEKLAAGLTPSQDIVSDIVFTHINLATLLNVYDARVRGIRQALDEGGDMLPLRRWSAERSQ
jgi:hypothetical protein